MDRAARLALVLSLGAGLLAAGCAAPAACAGDPGRGLPPEETVVLRFQRDEDLAAWKASGGEWKVEKGCALGRQVGDHYAYLTWPVYYGTISSVSIRGRIASRDNRNFRIQVGHIAAILNWECDDVDRFHDGWGDGRSVRGRALQGKGEHEILFVQDGDLVRILVDDRERWETRGRLRGTVTLHPAMGSTIQVREVVIRGRPVPWIPVDGPDQRAP